MAVRKVGVSARLLTCAKEEFLNRGFQGASIRVIAQKADTSPRAVYTRFTDKEGLFVAIVGEVAEKFLEMLKASINDFWHTKSISFEVCEVSPESVQCYIELIDFAYKNMDEFILILKCSEGTRYADFIEQATQINYNSIENYTNSEKVTSNSSTLLKLVYILTRSFYSDLFEPLLLNMTLDEAHFYVDKLFKFFSHGIAGIKEKQRMVDEEIILLPYYPNEKAALEWYQDPDVCKQIDNIDCVYTPERLQKMYDFLSTHGDCFYIQYRGKLVGDVTLQNNSEIAIVICKEYQNLHIGRRCVLDMIALAQEKGMGGVKANIYSFNEQSRRMFQSIGFRKIDEEWYLYKIERV